jgi:hypothetical protein
MAHDPINEFGYRTDADLDWEGINGLKLQHSGACLFDDVISTTASNLYWMEYDAISNVIKILDKYSNL